MTDSMIGTGAVGSRVADAVTGARDSLPPARPRRGAAVNPGAVVYPDNLAALGVCRALGAHGVPVSVLCSDRTGPGQYSRYGRRVACPATPEDAAALVRFLVDFGRRQQRGRPVLFLTDDASLVAVHRHRARLERWYRFPLAPWSVLRPMLMKDELYRSLEGVVPVPRTRVPADQAELEAAAREIGYPAVVKPLLRCLSAGAGPGRPSFEQVFGAKAIRVGTLAELTAAYRAARDRGFGVVVQEEVGGPIASLYSLGLYATRAGAVAAAFTSQKLGQVPADFGDGLIVRAAAVPELVPLGEQAIRHFGYYGMADIEFKRDAVTGDYKLLDINPRPWLWVNLPTACGVNLPYAAYLDATGRPPDPAEFAQRDWETRWVSARGLAVYVVRSLQRGRWPRGLGSLLGRARGPRVGPLSSPGDRLLRMFLDPRFWWESLRAAGAGPRPPRPRRPE